MRLQSHTVGAAVVEAILLHNLTFTTLYLYNNIRSNGAPALFKSLKTDSTLITLDLWDNSIGDNGAQSLFLRH